MPNQSNKKNKGFTIVESLVAIVILVLVITGVSGAIQTGISSYLFSKDQVIAFYLAQEGFEQIRNMRDENILSGRNWLSGISQNPTDPCWYGPPAKTCMVDPILSTTATECSGTCPVLRQHLTEFFYGYDPSWSATIFTRSIVLAFINANEISVTVTINWTKGTTPKQFKAKENLLNWP